MPALGDFFRLNLPQDFVAAWDIWLQQVMVSTRESFGAAWDARYLSAPIWQFSLAAGLCGAAPVIGVILPSVDRVGRPVSYTHLTLPTIYSV